MVPPAGPGVPELYSRRRQRGEAFLAAPNPICGRAGRDTAVSIF